jgi:arylsulfatase A-like enzyme
MVSDWDLEQVDVKLAEKAVSFINNHTKKSSNKPFFLYYALSAPHIPWVNPEFIRGASREGPRGDMNALVDWCVGEVRRTLEDQGILDDTIIILTSDNGPRRGAKGQRSAGPFRGYKNSAYEGGHRVPFIIRWSGRIKAGERCDIPISLADMMATFADYLNYRLPDNAAEDSISILPAFFDEGLRLIRRPALIADTGGHVSEIGDFSIRQGKWKLIEKNPKIPSSKKTANYELYNMKEDPYETQNIADAHSEEVDQMTCLLQVCKQTGLRFINDKALFRY